MRGRHDGSSTAPRERYAARRALCHDLHTQRPQLPAAMSLDSPLLSGGSPRITLWSIYDAISDQFVNGGVEESVMADFR